MSESAPEGVRITGFNKQVVNLIQSIIVRVTTFSGNAFIDPEISELRRGNLILIYST